MIICQDLEDLMAVPAGDQEADRVADQEAEWEGRPWEGHPDHPDRPDQAGDRGLTEGAAAWGVCAPSFWAQAV